MVRKTWFSQATQAHDKLKDKNISIAEINYWTLEQLSKQLSSKQPLEISLLFVYTSVFFTYDMLV